MSHISEHHTKQEGKGNACEHARVHFFVVGNTIGVDDLLEDISELIHSEQTWRLDSMTNNWTESWFFQVFVLFFHLVDGVPHVVKVSSRDPREPKQNFVFFFQFVERSVESFFFVQEKFEKLEQRNVVSAFL